MPWLAALAYFGLVFALGFVLGTVRTLLLLHGGTRLMGVLLELPAMLLASWWLCAWVLRRLRVPARDTVRLAMGGLAFVLLIAAEMQLGALLFGRTPAGHFALYQEASHALGLAAQVLFALMPWLRLRVVERRP